MHDQSAAPFEGENLLSATSGGCAGLSLLFVPTQISHEQVAGVTRETRPSMPLCFDHPVSDSVFCLGCRGYYRLEPLAQ
jgi:hypothetical protein